jgi:hypothetical protein
MAFYGPRLYGAVFWAPLELISSWMLASRIRVGLRKMKKKSILHWWLLNWQITQTIVVIKSVSAQWNNFVKYETIITRESYLFDYEAFFDTHFMLSQAFLI